MTSKRVTTSQDFVELIQIRVRVLYEYIEFGYFESFSCWLAGKVLEDKDIIGVILESLFDVNC